MLASFNMNETHQHPEMNIQGTALLFRHNKLFINGNRVKLPPTACRVLKHLLSHPEKIFSREQLLDDLWDKERKIDTRAVDANIRMVRSILQQFNLSEVLQTIHGVGYRCITEN